VADEADIVMPHPDAKTAEGVLTKPYSGLIT
jgi:hypothetical protein